MRSHLPKFELNFGPKCDKAPTYVLKCPNPAALSSSTGLKSADPPSKPNKMVIEEIESPDVVDEVAEIEQVDNRVPVSEPVVVKEEANLLFEGEKKSYQGGQQGAIY